jgi:hypothetical protein
MAGTIRKRTWVTRKGEAKSAWLADYFDQKRKRHTKQFPTKKAADGWLLRARGEVRDGTHTPDAESLTIAQAAMLWLERGEREQLEHGTLLGYRRCVRLHVNPLIGAIRLGRLTTPMVTDYRDELLRTRSRSMAQRALTLLKMIISEMQRRGLAAQNAAQPVTAVFTGMRVSELRGLTWDNVNFERGIIHVCQRADRWYTLGPPKTAAGSRDVPMAPAVTKVLKEWRLAFGFGLPSGVRTSPALCMRVLVAVSVTAWAGVSTAAAGTANPPMSDIPRVVFPDYKRKLPVAMTQKGKRPSPGARGFSALRSYPARISQSKRRRRAGHRAT